MSAREPITICALRLPSGTGPREIRTLHHPAVDHNPEAVRAELAAVPWGGAAGIVSADAYAQYVSLQVDRDAADEAGVLDDWGRVIDFDGARFEDWIDPEVRRG